MHTQDELRAGMNALATTTEPLTASTVLHNAKRYRSRRRLLAVASTATAVLAITGGAMIAAPQMLDRNATGHGPAVTTLSPTVNSPAPTPSMTRERRFTFGKETQTERGVYTTPITDNLTPELNPESAITLIRAPGQTTVPPKSDDWTGDTVRYITVSGTRVRVDEYNVADGTARQLTWSWRGAGYSLMADQGTTDEGHTFGANDSDLTWIIEQLMTRTPK